jgi:triosephosphate isomerase
LKKIFVANWKANKTPSQALDWLREAKAGLEQAQNVQVIICSSFLAIESLARELKGSQIKVGAQNVSSFPSGAYTGEVSAEILKGLVSYCIVGHSERRTYFGETEEQVAAKVRNLLEVGITPILCVANPRQLDEYLNKYSDIKDGVEKIVFVYEPPSAISGGGDYRPENPDEASGNISEFKAKIGPIPVLYGGSVNPEVIDSFLAQKEIDGFLVGKASLTSKDFVTLVSRA